MELHTWSLGCPWGWGRHLWDLWDLGSWAGPSQQQSKMEKTQILLLDLSHYGFTFLSMEEQIGLMSMAQLRKMQQGGKT